MFRATKVKHYLRRMEARGYSPEEVLTGSRIDPIMLNDPNYLIDISQSQRVVSNMTDLTGDAYLGFALGREASVDDLGIVGYAIMCSRSLRELIELWASLGHTLLGIPMHLKLQQREDCWGVDFREIARLGPLLRFCTEEIMTIGHRISTTISGRKLVYKNIQFAYPEPDNTDIYRETFDAEVLFDCPVTSTHILSPGPDDLNNKERDVEYYNVCRQYCFKVLREISQNRPLAFRVRQLLLDSVGSLPSVDDAANQMNMSVRTFKRHLSAEGVTYQQLVNDFKNDLAKEYLNSNVEMPVKKIADLLGYSEPKAFYRAFKMWNGCSIKEFKTGNS